MKGSSIPDGTIIAAGSIVAKKFGDNDANSIIGGVPAKIIKSNVTWHRERPSRYNQKKQGES